MKVGGYQNENDATPFLIQLQHRLSSERAKIDGTTRSMARFRKNHRF